MHSSKQSKKISVFMGQQSDVTVLKPKAFTGTSSPSISHVQEPIPVGALVTCCSFRVVAGAVVVIFLLVVVVVVVGAKPKSASTRSSPAPIVTVVMPSSVGSNSEVGSMFE